MAKKIAIFNFNCVDLLQILCVSKSIHYMVGHAGPEITSESCLYSKIKFGNR